MCSLCGVGRHHSLYCDASARAFLGFKKLNLHMYAEALASWPSCCQQSSVANHLSSVVNRQESVTGQQCRATAIGVMRNLKDPLGVVRLISMERSLTLENITTALALGTGHPCEVIGQDT